MTVTEMVSSRALVYRDRKSAGLLRKNEGSLVGAQIFGNDPQVMAQGAGIQTAERVAGAGVDAVLSGYVGPKAFEALQAAGIKVCQDLDGLTVREAVERFKSGGAPFADAPNK